MADTAAFENSNQIRNARQSPPSHLREAFVSGSAAGAVELREVPFLTTVGVRVDPQTEAGTRISSVTGGLPPSQETSGVPATPRCSGWDPRNSSSWPPLKSTSPSAAISSRDCWPRRVTARGRWWISPPTAPRSPAPAPAPCRRGLLSGESSRFPRRERSESRECVALESGGRDSSASLSGRLGQVPGRSRVSTPNFC